MSKFFLKINTDHSQGQENMCCILLLWFTGKTLWDNGRKWSILSILGQNDINTSGDE